MSFLRDRIEQSLFRSAAKLSGAFCVFACIALGHFANAQTARFVIMDPMPKTPLYYQIAGITDVSNDGQIIAVFQGSGGAYALTWEEGKGFAELPRGSYGDVTSTGGSGSPDGRYIPGSVYVDENWIPVVWIDKEGPYTLFTEFSALSFGISWDGTTIVGTLFDGPNWEAFLYSFESGLERLGGLTPLPGWPYILTDGAGPSQHADVLLTGGNRGLGTEGARWTRSAGWEPLGDLPGGAFNSFLGRASADGRAGAGRATPAEGGRGARWTEYHGWQNLSPLWQANSITGDGWRIYGGLPDSEIGIWDPVNGVQRLQDVLEHTHGINLGPWQIGEAFRMSENGRFFTGLAYDPVTEELRGLLVELPPFCYADCNADKKLDIMDYLCFIDEYDKLSVYANCNNDGAMDILDFICFGDSFAAGCP